MDYFYAQLNDENICIGISQLSEEVTQSNVIALSEEQYDLNLLGRTYQDGEWIAPQEESVEEEITEITTE